MAVDSAFLCCDDAKREATLRSFWDSGGCAKPKIHPPTHGRFTFLACMVLIGGISYPTGLDLHPQVTGGDATTRTVTP